MTVQQSPILVIDVPYMLSALELNGFKSFADKTRFEFPPGITVVVGPNGSGKSNIVDAVKWVLGAQSVKALRGKEMADVIFNGTGGRTPVNTADVTLTFDNSSGVLASDTKEVLITRRVYRSGEGEYFINKSPCRLRDIRELLAGTGIATDAYSIIEQGKVDVMLQSSPRDRRVLFEEAAGISRFKAKKAEAERRLARAEQNLLRLTDIVEEVDTRLRRIRAQASKARRYEEYTNRLKSLRLAAAARELASLHEDLLGCQHEVGELSSRQKALGERVAAATQHGKEREDELRQCEEALEQARGDTAAVREQIVRRQSASDQHLVRLRELDEQIAGQRVRLARTNQEAIRLAEQIDHLEQRCRDSRKTCGDAAGRLTTAQGQAEQMQRQVQAFIARVKQARLQREEAAQQHGSLERQISVLRSQLASAHAAEEKCRSSVRDLSAQKESLLDEAQLAEQSLQEVTRQVEHYGQQLHQTQQLAAKDRKTAARLQSELSDLKLRRTAATQRAAVLEELQERLEGVGAGTKQVLLEARSDRTGELSHVRGLVADLLHVDVEMAPLVELVLGPRANLLVVDSPAAVSSLATRVQKELPGRAGFIAVDDTAAARDITVSPLGEEGLVERLDRLTDAAAEDLPLARKLLGTVWLVEDLATAIRLAPKYPALGFVTRSGEYLASDGTLLMGPKDGEAGILSRHSQLKALRLQVADIDRQRDEVAQQHKLLEKSIAEHDQLAEALSPEHAALTGKLSEERLRTTAIRNRLQQVESLYEARQRELEAADQQVRDIEAELATSQTSLERAEDALNQADSEFRQSEELLDAERARQLQAEQQLSNIRVDLATAEQELKSLQGQLDSCHRQAAEAESTADMVAGQLQGLVVRRAESRHAALQEGSELALAYLRQEELLAAVSAQSRIQAALRKTLNEHRKEQDSLQDELRNIERSLQERELTARQLDHEKDLLINRYREEYEVELEEYGKESSTDSQPEAASTAEREQEIADLRRKINNLGAVNLEAVSELNDLEVRHERLDQQLRDLTSAKESLEQIIARINADSRKMFLATIDVVRQHFQELFRRLFGGGQADIVLEGDESEDVLERGIEIVARPPGKEPRSISLLSGGEKTLTCVALLLAVFRSRPSPFCILDEVDAALDEANIERFASVLREFLHSTQFIVVTHSKRTMSFADTLYGITMQETGVSKPVSVRFDDRSTGTDDAPPQAAGETQAA